MTQEEFDNFVDIDTREECTSDPTDEELCQEVREARGAASTDNESPYCLKRVYGRLCLVMLHSIGWARAWWSLNTSRWARVWWPLHSSHSSRWARAWCAPLQQQMGKGMAAPQQQMGLDMLAPSQQPQQQMGQDMLAPAQQVSQMEEHREYLVTVYRVCSNKMKGCIVQRPDSLFDPGSAMQLVKDLATAAKRESHRKAEDYQAVAEILRLHRHDPEGLTSKFSEVVKGINSIAKVCPPPITKFHDEWHEKIDVTLEELEKVQDKLSLPTPIVVETD
ncbi:Hypp8220 [Branchiostoma lanceolatum]|uniref:Hypp8220 protein n=1 Tax=Branchiostoma lanceolatum TaxID=7740 RepID=A0A8J9Z805_BRALA|nr:Hypp8220 [Branchiostoma lanceolatum]